MTRVFRSVAEWLGFRQSSLRADAKLGFVPTMGALHEGHLSIVRRSAAENDFTLVSIFVNPTQFDDPRDLARYPRTFERDLAVLEGAGADFLLFPEPSELYPDQYRYRVSETQLSRELCGAHRPGHFDGMLTVVMKLLNLARARRAYFGEKDFQQLELVRGMARAFFLETEIFACPTVREGDGLAMSSRNVGLTPEQRALAARFPGALRSEATPEAAAQLLRELGFGVDYVEDRFGRRLGAVRLGEVRLIDNVERCPS